MSDDKNVRIGCLVCESLRSEVEAMRRVAEAERSEEGV